MSSVCSSSFLPTETADVLKIPALVPTETSERVKHASISAPLSLRPPSGSCASHQAAARDIAPFSPFWVNLTVDGTRGSIQPGIVLVVCLAAACRVGCAPCAPPPSSCLSSTLDTVDRRCGRQPSSLEDHRKRKVQGGGARAAARILHKRLQQKLE